MASRSSRSSCVIRDVEMLITLLTGPGTIGAPVVNEYSELIGIIGGVAAPHTVE